MKAEEKARKVKGTAEKIAKKAAERAAKRQRKAVDTNKTAAEATVESPQKKQCSEVCPYE